MTFEFHDFLGLVGTGMVVISYLMLQLERIRSEHLSYSVLNALGAALILYSLIYDFNLAALIIETFWVLISMIGIWKYFRNSKSTRPAGVR